MLGRHQHSDPPIKIRKALAEDVQALWNWYSSEQRQALMKLKNSAWLSREQLGQWFRSARRQQDLELLIGLYDSLRMGGAVAQISGSSAVLYLALKPCYCGKGLLRPFAEATASYVRKTRTSVCNVNINVSKFNRSSATLFESAKVDSVAGAEVFRVEL
jgi:hypothetical protein